MRGDARIEGIEADFTWHPDDQWTLSLNGDYLNDRFTKINATSTAFNVGDELDFTPKYQFTVSAQRDFSWNGRLSFMRLDYSERGRESERNRSIGPWYYYQSDIIRTLNYYIGLQWNESLSLNLFAQNLLNDRGIVAPVQTTVLESRPRPRTYGIEFSVKFE